MFDLNQLRCFVTVAEELHFGRAAARLNMTQPPLSRQIQVLEHIIEAPLLKRTSRSVLLTPAGRSFLPEARRILKLAEAASHTARRIATGKSGSLKIGFTAVASYSFLPAMVAACRGNFTEIDFTLKEMVSGDQIEALTTGQIDVGLMRPPISRPEFSSLRVSVERLLAAVPSSYPAAQAESLSIRDFDGQPFVMYSPHESRYFHDLVLAQFTRANVMPRYVQHLSQIHSIVAMVKAGLGMAIVPESAAGFGGDDVTMKPLRLRTPAPAELYLVWRNDCDNPLLPFLLDIVGAMTAAERP